MDWRLLAPLAAAAAWGLWMNTKPRNVRNNNPLNIRKGSEWEVVEYA